MCCLVHRSVPERKNGRIAFPSAVAVGSGTDTAQRRKRNSQVRSNEPEIGPLTDVRELFLEFFVPLFGRKSQPLLVAAVQTPVLVLMDNPSPVTELQIGFKQADQICQRYPVGLHLFQGLYKGFLQTLRSPCCNTIHPY